VATPQSWLPKWELIPSMRTVDLQPPPRALLTSLHTSLAQGLGNLLNILPDTYQCQGSGARCRLNLFRFQSALGHKHFQFAPDTPAAILYPPGWSRWKARLLFLAGGNRWGKDENATPRRGWEYTGT
jgi:hypothetical protein